MTFAPWLLVSWYRYHERSVTPQLTCFVRYGRGLWRATGHPRPSRWHGLGPGPARKGPQLVAIDFVDAHIHLFHLGHPTLKYAWLEPDFVHPVIGDINAMKSHAYTVEAFTRETRFSRVKKAVHVQAALGSDDPVEETKWIEEQVERSGFPLALVGDARMQSADVEKTLERQADYPNMRGIRDFAEGDYLVDPNFERGYALLEKYNLSYDLDCTWENMEKAKNLAEKYPDILMILGHAGFPQERTDEYFGNWRAEMTTLAEAENVVCKISGLGMVDQRWTVESLRPWVLHSIDAFGVDRCMFGTNWPVDRLFSSYNDVVHAYLQIVTDFSDEEKKALFSANAEKYYRF